MTREIPFFIRLVFVYVMTFAFVSQQAVAQQGVPPTPPPQQITPDGRTLTNVAANGNVTDVTTQTTRGQVAYNSFTTFNVGQGNVVNLYLPGSTTNLLNLVHSEQVNIWGVLNSIKDGSVGGDVMFADPFGVVVGKDGVVNVGSLTVVTPTKTFMDSFFEPDGNPSAAGTQALLDGTVPISADGNIAIQGRVNALNDIRLLGKNVANSGSISNGAVFTGSQPDFSDVVNVNGLQAGTAMALQNGNIVISAQNDFSNSGTIATLGGTNLNAGNIDIHAGGNITLDPGTLISASGAGTNSNAGNIHILADQNAAFNQGVALRATGGELSGNGGLIEFSAKKTLALNGGSFDASAAHGTVGSILIDPTDLTATNSQTTNGTPVTISASDSVTMENGYVLDTTSTTSAAGDVTVKAPTIAINDGAKILAGPTNPNAGGTVSISASSNVLEVWLGAWDSSKSYKIGDVVTSSGTSYIALADNSNADPTSDTTNWTTLANFQSPAANASITIGAATIIGKEIDITANATSSKSAEIKPNDDGSRTAAPPVLSLTIGGGGNGAFSIPSTDLLSLVGVNDYVGGIISNANANIQINGATLNATGGNVKVDAEASSTANLNASGLYINYVESNANATAKMNSGSVQVSGGDFNLTAHSTNLLTNKGSMITGEQNKDASNQYVSSDGPSITFVYSKGDSTSIAGVEKDATVNAANVNVTAKNEKTFATTAAPKVNNDTSSAQQYGEGVGIAVMQSNSSADAHIYGSATTTGAVLVDAEALNTEAISSTAVVKTDPSSKDDKSSNTDNAKNQTQTDTNNASAGNEDSRAKTSTLALGAAISYLDSTNTAKASIGDGTNQATISAGGDVTVKANASEASLVAASGTASAATISIGGAVAISKYDNEASAKIGAGSVVDSAGTLDVNANATMPNPGAAVLLAIEQYLENFSLAGLGSDIGNLLDGVRNSFSNGGVSGGVGDVKQLGESVETAYKNVTEKLSTSVSSTGAVSSGSSSFGGSGAVNVLNATNKASAVIGNGAQVNQNAGTSAVKVEATATVQAVHAEGDDVAQASSKSASKTSGVNSTSSGGGKSGEVGGTYSGITYNNDATAYVDDGAKVKSGSGKDISVTANATEFLASKVSSGADGSSNTIFGLSGAVSNVNDNSTARAYVEDSAVLNSGNDVNVNASHSAQIYELTGATDSANSVGIGIAVGLTHVRATTEAFIGDNNGSTTPPGSVTAAGNVGVSSTGKERLVALSASYVTAGGSTSSNSGTTAQTPSAAEQSGASNTADKNTDTDINSYGGTSSSSGKGFGLSGDVALNFIDNHTKSWISDGVTVNANGSTGVNATDNTLLLAADGGLVRASTAGFAGAFADNDITKDTEAKTDGVNINTGSLSVTSNSTNKLLAATAGGAVTTGNGTSYANIAGSVNWDKLHDTTLATSGGTVRGSDGSSRTGDVNVQATNQDTVFSVAGSFAVNGKIGVGVGIDIGDYAPTVKASVAPSADVKSNGAVNVNAQSNNNALSVAAAVAVAGDNDIAGAITYDTTNKDTEAFVGNGATVDTTGTVGITAKDDTGANSMGLPTGLIAIAGSVAVGTDTLGLGAAGAFNFADKTVSAYADTNSKVWALATPGVLIDAENEENYNLFAADGGYGAKVGIMGSFVSNNIGQGSGDFTKAWIASGANVGNNGDYANSGAGQGVTVAAINTTTIHDGAGAVPTSSKVAIGAAGDIELVNQNVSTEIAGTVKANNNVTAMADLNQDVFSLAVVGGGAGTATIVGSGSVLEYGNNVSSDIAAGANVTANNNVGISADNTANIRTIDGQGGGAGTVGIGASISYIDKTDNTSAYIADGTAGNGATVTAKGNGTDIDHGLTVNAATTNTLNPMAVGGSGSGGVSINGAGVINLLTPTTNAYIGNNANINPLNDGGALQQVEVSATTTDVLPLSLAGAAAGALYAGIGGSADVTKLTNTTTAEIKDATVNSKSDISVQASSLERSNSIAAAIGGAAYAGVAGAVSVYTVNDTTQALVDTGATLTTGNNALIAAEDDTYLTLLDGANAGAIGAVNGSAAVVDVKKTTNAKVGDAVITASGSGNAVNADNGSFNVTYPSYGLQSDGNFPRPSFNTDTNTSHQNTFFSNANLSGQHTATPNTTAVHGVAVTSTSINRIDTLMAGFDAGAFGASLAGSVTLLDNTTHSEIGPGAQITGNGAGTSVLVAAGTDLGRASVVGGIGFGIGMAIPGADVAIIKNTTTADIADTTSFNPTSVTAAGSVVVNAQAQEDMLSLVAGLGVSGGTGLVGSVSYLGLDDTTKSYVGGFSTVNANNGGLTVSSTDNTYSGELDGAAGIGLAVNGFGASVGITKLNKDTEASVKNNATTNAKGETKVTANNVESLSTGAVAGGIGTFNGAAGSVSVELLTTTTSASIGNASVNQTLTDGSGQKVTVSATNDVDATLFDGAVGGSLLSGIAGAVDVGVISDNTSATIGAGDVSAGGNVGVTATESRTIQSNALSGGVALGVGIAASVSDWGISAPADSNKLSAASYGGGSASIQNDANNSAQQMASTIGSGQVLGASSQSSAGQKMAAAAQDVNAKNTAPVSNFNSTTSGTTAQINGASVTTSGAVNINSNDTTSLSMYAGELSGGLIGGAGAGVGVANVNTGATASIGAGSDISAGGNVVVGSSRTDNMSTTALAGSGGLVLGASAAYASITDNGTNTAAVNGNVDNADDLQISATTNRSLYARTGQGAIGAVAVGGAITTANAGGSTSASIGGGAAIGTGTGNQVGSVHITADSNDAAQTYAKALSLGILSGDSANTNTNIHPTVSAYIGNDSTLVNTSVNTTGDVQVTAKTEEDATANTQGTNISAGVSTGNMTASATTSPTVKAYVGKIGTGTNGIHAGGNVSVAAKYNFGNTTPLGTCSYAGQQNCQKVQATAGASGGSLLVSSFGTQATANSTPTLDAHFAGSSEVDGANVTLQSLSASSAYTKADGNDIAGIDLPGKVNATTNIDNNNNLYIAGTVNATGDVTATAQSQDNATGADVIGSHMGVVSLSTNTSTASAYVTGSTGVTLKNGGQINGKNVTLQALVGEQGHSNASTSSLGAITTNSISANAGSDLSSGAVDTPTVITESGSNINAVKTATLLADVTQAQFDSNAYSRTMALGSNSNATSNTNVAANPSVSVNGDINAPTSITLKAIVNTDAGLVHTDSTAQGDIDAGFTGNLSASATNNTTFDPYVHTGTGVTLTTNNLYVEASGPVPSSSDPSNPSNPYYNKTAIANANTVVHWVLTTVEEVVDEVVGWIPFVGDLIKKVVHTVTKWVEETLQSDVNANTYGTYKVLGADNKGTYAAPPTGIDLNGTIIQPGGGAPHLEVDANGNVTVANNISAQVGDHDIFVNDVANQSVSLITLNTPSGPTSGQFTIQRDSAFSSVILTNNSNKDLVVGNINPYSTNGGNPDVNITADPNRDNVNWSTLTPNTVPTVTITNNSGSNVFLSGFIDNPGGNVTVSNLLGSILGLTTNLLGNATTNLTEGSVISLTANHGSIGSSAIPLNFWLTNLSNAASLPSGVSATPSFAAFAGHDLYASLTAVEHLSPGESLPTTIAANLGSIKAGDNIGLTLNPGAALVPTVTVIPDTDPLYQVTEVPTARPGTFTMTADMNAGGNVALNLPTNATLALNNHAINSGFADLNFSVNSLGNWSSSPIGVNYSDSINGTTVTMQNLANEGGSVAITGGGALSGTGSIQVLNGFTQVNINNASSKNLVVNGLNYDNARTGQVNIFGTTYTGTGVTASDTTHGATIALSTTGHSTGGITVSNTGSGDVQLAGSILNQTGTTSVTNTGGNIVNNGGSAQVIKSHDITLSATGAGKKVGASTTPINIDLRGGSVTATANSDVALNETNGDMTVSTITSGGNVYLTAAGSIVDVLNTIFGVNLYLTATGGSIGSSSNPLDIVATGTLNATAQTDAYITQVSGGLNVNNVTANTGNVGLTTAAGDMNLGTVTATLGNATLTSSGNVNFGTGTLNAQNGTATVNAGMNITDNTTTAAVINANNAVLNSTSGNIGSSLKPIEVNSAINSNAGTMSAAAANGTLWVNEIVGPMNVGAVSASNGNVNLTTSQGDINGGTVSSTNGNVNETAMGNINGGTITAANGNVNLVAASSGFANGDIKAGNITATAGATSGTGNANLTAAGAILNNDPPSGVNVTAGAMNLAAGSIIGTADEALTVNTTGTGLTATAPGSIYVTQPIGNLAAVNVNSSATGNVGLSAAAGNLNASAVTTNNGNINLSASGDVTLGTATAGNGSATLNAGNNVNLGVIKAGVDTAITAGNDVTSTTGSSITTGRNVNVIAGRDIDLSQAPVTATAGSVNLNAQTNASYSTITATNGDTAITAGQNIADTGSAGDVESNNINFNATAGSINVGGTLHSKTGNVNLTAGTGVSLGTVNDDSGNVNIAANTGDVTLGKITASAGDTNIHAGGSILNSPATPANITSNNITLTADNGKIGTDSAHMLTLNSNAGAPVTPGVVTALAKLGIYLQETTGPMYVNYIRSQTSDIYILSDGSILDANPVPTSSTFGSFDGINLVGNYMNLVSTNGSIGQMGQRLNVYNYNPANAAAVGNKIDMQAKGDIAVAEQWGDMGSNNIATTTGNVDLLVNAGSAFLGNIKVAPQPVSPATYPAAGSTYDRSVVILVQGSLLKANSITFPKTLSMTVQPIDGGTSNPQPTTINVGEADVYSNVTARADYITLSAVRAMNANPDTNDLQRQANGLHFDITGWDNPADRNWLTNLAKNVTINVVNTCATCTVPAVVFDRYYSDFGNVTSTQEWLETIHTIVGTHAYFQTPWENLAIDYKFPQQQSATRYNQFYMFMIGNKLSTNVDTNYWNSRVQSAKKYNLTQQFNTIVNDLIKYYGLQ